MKVRNWVATAGVALAFPAAAPVPGAAAQSVVECGNPAGAARNVTAVGVSCSDARSFARQVASRRITRSGRISLPGWRPYSARVRRVGGGYDVRATRGGNVIRFQYTAPARSRSSCDPNYVGACLNPSSADYDCAGGSGNGPDYTGPVRVIGDDHFDLDRDGDGVGCEA